jgi:CheY-like chemotaxis protein
VAVVVRDEGVGMSEELVYRIFEPFFTTKGVGRGTGLGLSTVHGIVRTAGGTIAVESELGRGTTFRVYLPRTTVSEDEDSNAETDSVPRGSEWVLVVEDEEQVRAVAVRTLRRLGYHVVEAGNARELEQVLDKVADRLDLLLTDVVMPDIRAPEVAALVVSRAPRVTVVFMSGYSDASAWGRTEIPADANLLEKPLRPDVLGRTIRRALDKAAKLRR